MLALWAAVGLAGVLADVWSGAFAGVFVAAASLAALLAGSAGLPRPVQIAAFLVLSAGLLGLVRPLLHLQRRSGAFRPELLVGKLGSVLDPVEEQMASGRVVIEGVPYVARGLPGAPPIGVGAAIRVRAVESGDIIVEPL